MAETAKTAGPSTVTVLPAEDGRLTVRKTASSPPDRARLEREAAILARLPDRGVARLRSWDADAGRLELEHAGEHTLETAPPRRIEETTALLGAIATTLSTTHGRGISHGRLEPSHVVLTAEGSPVLVGWADAGVAEIRSRPGTSPVPAGPPFDPDGDVAAFGRLAQTLLERTNGSSRSGGRARTRVAAVAAAAAHPDTALRPTLVDIVRILTAEISGAGTEGPGRPSAARPRWSAALPHLERLRGRSGALSRRHAVLFAVTVVVGAAATTGAVLLLGPRSATAPAPGASEVGQPLAESSTDRIDVDSAPAPTPTTSSNPAAPTPLSCPRDTVEAAAVGLPVACRDQMTVSDRRIEVGGTVVELGDDGDLVALADVACDGRLDAVLLRAGTGEVFVFDGWARRDQPLDGRLLDRVADATAISANEDGGCPAIVLTLADGTTTELESAGPS